MTEGATETETSASYDDTISAIGGIVDNAVITWYNIATQQADPCNGANTIQSYEATVWRPNYLRATAAARRISERLAGFLTRSISTGGHSGGTGQPLEVFLLRWFGAGDELQGAEYLLPPSALVGLGLGPCLFPGPGCSAALHAWVRDRLPGPNQLLGTEPIPRTTENSPSSGVGLQGSAGRRKYTGPEIIAAVDAWREQQISEASPSALPRARAQLTELVGTWIGSGPWGIWQSPTNPESAAQRTKQDNPENYCPGVGSLFDQIQLGDPTDGDPISQSSKVGEILRLRMWQQDLLVCLRRECGGSPEFLDPLAGSTGGAGSGSGLGLNLGGGTGSESGAAVVADWIWAAGLGALYFLLG